VTAITILHGSADRYGASRVLCSDARMLVQAGHDVTCVLAEDGPLVDDLLTAGIDVTVERMSVIRRATGLKRTRLPRLPRAALSADVVVLWTLALALYAPALQMRRRRFGVSVHEYFPSRTGNFLARLATTGATWVHTNSLVVRMWIQRAGRLRSGCILTAYPAVGMPPVMPTKVATTSLRLALAGRTNGRKGHLQAIEATVAARMRGLDVSLDLYGDPYPGQEDHLRVILRRASGVPYVTYLGRAERPRYQEYDLMLFLPTAPESFGLTPVEAWADGTRTLGVPLGGGAESLALCDALVVEPTGSDILAGIEWYFFNRCKIKPMQRDAPAATLCTVIRRRQMWECSLCMS